MLKRVILLIIGSMLVTLLLTTVAMAWTPQDIYNDFVTNGKLTHEYTQSELRAYLNDSTLAQYADRETKKRLDQAVSDLVNRNVFPFTGFQIAMGLIVVVVLVGGGVALRFFTKPRRRREQS